VVERSQRELQCSRPCSAGVGAVVNAVDGRGGLRWRRGRRGRRRAGRLGRFRPSARRLKLNGRAARYNHHAGKLTAARIECAVDDHHRAVTGSGRSVDVGAELETARRRTKETH